MNDLWLFLTIMLDAYPFIFLQYLPFRNKLKIGYPSTMLACATALFLQFLGFLWLTSQPSCTLTMMLLYRCSLMITLCLLTVFFVRDNFYKEFFVFGLMAPYVVITIVSGSFMAQLLQWESASPYMASVICRMVVIALSFPPLYFLAKRYLVLAMAVQDNSIWRYAFPMPMMFSLVSLLYVNKDYEQQKVPITELLGMLSVFLGCIFTCFFLLKALGQAKEKAELTEQSRQSHQLLLLQQEQYALIAKHIDEAKAARHDLRHHLSVITSFIHDGKIKELADYVAIYSSSLPIDTELTICENYAVDSIVSHYVTQARAQGIHTTVALDVPASERFSDIDLCVILGNCLENAIEGSLMAPEGERFIHVMAKPISGLLTLTIDNSFDGVCEKNSGRYLSRKRNYDTEGVGLVSVGAIVKAAEGILQVEQKQNVFMVSITLPI